MTDQPTEGWLATELRTTNTYANGRRVFDVHMLIPAVSVVESDRRRDEAVLAERNRFLAIVDAHRPSLGDGLTEMLLAAIAAGIESGEPA